MKNIMSRVSLNALSKIEKDVLLDLKPFFKVGGILSGGTALMLQLPFRKSYDFDLFFPYEIPDNFLRKASKIFNSNIKILINNIDELTFITGDQIKISFIYFPFKRKYKPILSNSIILSLFKDIASDKAYAISRRPEYRDYVDLFIIFKNGFNLERTILDAKEKFKGEFSEKLFLSQLVYFEDLKDFTVEFIKEKYSINEIKGFFKQVVNELTLTLLSETAKINYL
jgi:hypothetical protein